MLKQNSWPIFLIFLLSAGSLAQSEGEWENPFPFGDATHQEIVAVHLIHLHTGKVLVHTSFDQGGLDFYCLINPPHTGVPR